MFDLTAWAKEAVGWRYAHGGRSPGTVDCYGLVLLYAKAVGVSLPDYDYAEDWTRRGEDHFAENWHRFAELAPAAIPGDLALFKTRGGVVSHIGIALGQVRFLHASKRGVSIERFARQPFCRTLDSIVRLKGAAPSC